MSDARRVWCAYHTDFSDLVLFGREIDALRYATANGMQCKPVEYGTSAREQLLT